MIGACFGRIGGRDRVSDVRLSCAMLLSNDWLGAAVRDQNVGRDAWMGT
jgi:hypothetical protein